MRRSIASLYLLITLILGGTYLLYETKDLPTRYAYEEALQDATQQDHIAKLTIYPTISYGGSGHNSLHKIIHTIELLSESNTNKGLVITLALYDQATGDEIEQNLGCCGFSNYIILKNALQAYQKKTRRKIIVHMTHGLAFPFLCVLAIADVLIWEPGTIEENKLREIFPLEVNILTNLVENAIPLISRVFTSQGPHVAMYKAQNDPKEMKQIEATHHSTTNHSIKIFTQTAGKSSLDMFLHYPQFPPQIPYEGMYKKENDPKEDKKMKDAYNRTINDAIKIFKEKRGGGLPLFDDLDDSEKEAGIRKYFSNASKKGREFLHQYLDGHEKNTNLEKYIKAEITNNPIIHLTPLINGPAEYTPQQRNQHRHTEACFETITISGEINPTLVKKIKPLIQSVHCDPNIKGVIIVWDSPGGDVSSAKRLLHLLKKLNSAKPIIHVATNMCASAAYLLAASTGEQLIAYSNTRIGSIGVRAKEKMSPGTIAWKKEAQQLAKTRQWMIEAIAHNRAERLGINAEVYHQKLYDTEARTYTATRAQEKQLIDRIGTLQDAINILKEQTELDLPVYYSDNETNFDA